MADDVDDEKNEKIRALIMPVRPMACETMPDRVGDIFPGRIVKLEDLPTVDVIEDDMQDDVNGFVHLLTASMVTDLVIDVTNWENDRTVIVKNGGEETRMTMGIFKRLMDVN